MTYLFYVLYPKELRDLIQKLRSEDKLIKEPLKNLTLTLIGISILLLMPLTAYKMFEDPMAMILFILSFLFILLVINSYCRSHILPASKGILTRGKIANYPYLRGVYPFPFPYQKKVWIVKYTTIASKNKDIIYTLKIPEKYLSPEQLKCRDIVKVLYLKSNPKHNIIALDKFIDLFRINKDPITK